MMSLALTPSSAEQYPTFMKALQRFQKEDPTFRVRAGAGGGEGEEGRGREREGEGEGGREGGVEGVFV